MRYWKFATIVGGIGLSMAAQATFYTSEAAFLAAINPTYYLEDFPNFTSGDPLDGSQTSWVAPGANGYGWTASAVDGLFADDGALSVNLNQDELKITFTGSPVSAFGGILTNTDIAGDPNDSGTITLTMSNGDTSTIALGGFLGWVGTSSVTSATITAQGHLFNGDPDGFDWPTMDHAYTGAQASSVPEPASMAALGLGALALIRRRKNK